MLLVGVFLIGVAKAQKNQKLAGAWFLCEFAHSKIPPSDGCSMLDDDGFMVREGILYHIKVQESHQKGCRGERLGNCLVQGKSPVTAVISEIGSIEVVGNQLKASFLGCTQVYYRRFHGTYVEIGPAEDRCFWTSDKSYFLARYLGELVLIGDQP